MYRQIIIPESTNFLLNLPSNFIGRKIEIIAFDIGEATAKVKQGKKISGQQLEDYFSHLKFDVKSLKLSRNDANEKYGFRYY